MLSHVDESNQPRMVDVSDKTPTRRVARARAVVALGPEIMALLEDGDIKGKKGPVFHTAIVAGTMGCKRTAELIPFCHPLSIDDCHISIEAINDAEVEVECTVTVHHRTGVEMEALTGASIAALTVYDMCKAMSKDIVVRDLRLIEKRGGKSDFQHRTHPPAGQ